MSSMLIEITNKISDVTTPLGMKTKIIAIDGCGGAGKSTLAAQLSKNLGDCPVIHTDDFASWDNPLNWHPRMIEQVFVPLSQNKPAHFQRFDWKVKAMTDWISISLNDFVIVEGVSSSRSEFRSFLSFSIFVETPAEIRLRRGLDRDGLQARDLWLKWMAEEDRYLEKDDPKSNANVVFNGA
jgi:uridine kinase